MANNVNYILEIYVPNSRDTLLFRATSENTFPKFVKGDELRTVGYEGQTIGEPDLNLIIDKVEYLVWKAEKFNISTQIFTKEKEEWLISGGESKALNDPSG